MLTAKQLLRKHAAEAFAGRADMPLTAALEGVTAEQAAWQPTRDVPSIEQIVRHVAWAKSHYCREGFGAAMVLDDESINSDGDCAALPQEFPCGAGWGIASRPGIAGAIGLLRESHAVLTACLEQCPDKALERPIPTRHGRSAAHFFWIMAMHDLYHAGQIRTRRTWWQARGAK